MKKKILLAIAMVSVFVCLFALAVSAASTETIDGVTYYLNNGYASVTNANQKCTLETVIIPDTVVGADGKEYVVNNINQQAFYGNKNIKYVSLPSTMTTLNAAAFRDCTNLVFVDFNDNPNKITSNGYGIFRNCTSLKAICLPDGMTTIPDQCFTSCTNLTAVYLPANLEILKGNKSANDGPAFGHSPSLFFTNDKFEVRDENGSFYTAETFAVPERPTIYYMPSTLKTITANHNASSTFSMDENGMVTNTGAEDCGIYNCPNINDIIVMPEGYQGYDDRTLTSGSATFTEHKGDTIQSGLFQKCGTAEKPLTVIWLGEIDRLSLSRRDSSSYTTYVFANPANTSFENTKIGTWYNTSDTNYSGQNEMYVVFCHAEGGAQKYKVSFSGTANNAPYPVLNAELQDIESDKLHMISPRDNKVIVSSCTDDGCTELYCFCGKLIDRIDVVPALGHEANELLNKYFATVNGTLDYYSDMITEHSCTRCDAIIEGTEAGTALFTKKGYSYSENDATTFSYTIYVNADAIKAYNEALLYGIVVSANANGAPISYADGKISHDNKTIAIEFQNTDIVYSIITAKLTGVTATTELHLSAYCVDNGAVSYLGHSSVDKIAETISYEVLMGKYPDGKEE